MADAYEHAAQPWHHVFGGLEYLSVSRDESAALIAQAIEAVYAEYADELTSVPKPASEHFKRGELIHVCVPNLARDLHTLICTQLRDVALRFPPVDHRIRAVSRCPDAHVYVARAAKQARPGSTCLRLHRSFSAAEASLLAHSTDNQTSMSPAKTACVPTMEDRLANRSSSTSTGTINTDQATTLKVPDQF
ncbi:hypothetical protein [Burkholderia cepacia]|uniref:hypothetical protein n=1 Tax=Burkholderia cepacia TaxID=292 RepID=UPI000ADF9572|nr:hypothetical protein [Burkholderia cepacia]